MRPLAARPLCSLDASWIQATGPTHVYYLVAVTIDYDLSNYSADSEVIT